MRIFSPAKLNLFFRVLDKRGDGYHEIASLYQAIDFYDEIYIDIAKKDTFICLDTSIPKDDSNLCIKALHLFRQKTAITTPIKIELIKRIPMGAGLGGGSSNAASILWGLCQLFDLSISNQTLTYWGAELGSDVAFFFSNGSSYCTGRGEVLSEGFKTFVDKQVWLLHSQHLILSTPKVYQRCQANESCNTSPIQLLKQYQKGHLPLVNDLQPAAFRLQPKLQWLYEQLKQIHVHNIAMTGSGSAFFTFSKPPAIANNFCSVYHAKFTYRKNDDWYLAKKQ